MVTQQSAKDAAVLATFMLVLTLQWKGVAGDNRRRSRRTSWNDDLLELETSREPFGNDEELVGDSLQQELRGVAQSEDVDASNGGQGPRQDGTGLEAELQDDQLLGEGVGGARVQRAELATQEDQQLQPEQFSDNEDDEYESQDTRRVGKESRQLQQQQLSDEKRGREKVQGTLLETEESRQLQKMKPLNVGKSETMSQRAQHEVGGDQQMLQKSPSEENSTVVFARVGVAQKDKEQSQQEQLKNAEKSIVVLQRNQPDTIESNQLQREQFPSVIKGGAKVQNERLEARDSHDLQEEMLSKQDSSEVRFQHAPIEIKDVNRQLTHDHVADVKNSEGRAQRAQLETKQKWKVKRQQSPKEEKSGNTNRYVKYGMEENHQLQQKQLHNQEQVGVESNVGKLDVGDTPQHQQNHFDSGEPGVVSPQHGQVEAKGIKKLKQQVEEGTASGQLDVEQQQLRQLAAFGKTSDSGRRSQEAGKQPKPESTDEMSGLWLQPGNLGKVSGLVHREPSSVDKWHPNEYIAMDNSGHVGLPASERLATSKQNIQSKGPTVMRDDILMAPSGSAETDLSHDLRDSEDRERIGRIDTIGWQPPGKVGATEPQMSDTQHGGEQWLQTAGSKLTGHVQQELPAAADRDGPAGVKPADDSHHAHTEVEKVKKRTRNKAVSLEHPRTRRRNKAAATAAGRQQRHQRSSVVSRTQRQQFQPDDVLQAALAAQLGSTEAPAANLDVQLMTSNLSRVEGKTVGRVAVVLVSSPPAATIASLGENSSDTGLDLLTTAAIIPSVEVDTNVTVVDLPPTTASAPSLEVDTSTSDNSSVEVLLLTSESDTVATRVLQGMQRRTQQSARLRQHILPSLRSAPPPREAPAAGGRPGPCNATTQLEAEACERRRLVGRAMSALKRLQRLELGAQRCPAPEPGQLEQLRQLLQFAPPAAEGAGVGVAGAELSRRIRHLRALVADYEKLTAAEKSQVRGVRDYLARQLNRLYSLSQASTLPTPITREVTELQQQLQLQPQREALFGKEAATAALLEALRRHSQLPARRDAFQRRLRRRLASRARRDAYAQLAVSAADARFRMPPV